MIAIVRQGLLHLQSKRAVGLSIATALLLSSCGGGGDAQPLTKAQYIKQASAICKEGVEAKEQAVQAKFKELAKKEGKPSEADYEAVISAAIPALDKMTQELGDLSAPSKDEKTVSRMVDQFGAAVKKAEEDPGLVLKADPFEGAAETARSYGIEDCIV